MGSVVDHVQERFTQAWSRPSWWNLAVIFPWVIGLVVTIYDWQSMRVVAQREKTTWGKITAHERDNHNRYGYTFSLGGKPFTGWETPQENELEIGQHVLVYYDPLDPRNNALTDFAELSAQNLEPVPIMLLGIGGVAFFIAYRRRKTRPTSEDKT